MSRTPREHALEPSIEAMGQMVDTVMGRLAPHVAGLGGQPASYDLSLGPGAAQRLSEPALPQSGSSLEALLSLVFDEAIPVSFNAAGPSYMGYIPGGGLFEAALGAFIAAAINRYVGVWLAAPGLVQLEANVLRWFCHLVGYPPEAMGTLTSGGSIANLSALIAARRDKLGEDFLDGVVYASDQTHYSIHKAATMAGLRRSNLRTIPTDSRQRIRLDALKDALAADRSRGLAPFLLVGNAGTTNTGAVDDLSALADLAQAEGLWFHVDAAYGGFFMLTNRGKDLMKGIDRADSITLDPHKGLFLPFGTGALLARDRRTLERAFDDTGDYMPGFQVEDTHVDFCRISPELSRSFRGLRIWLPLKLHGIGPFRDCLEEKLDLTQRATDALSHMPGVEIVAPPQLSVVAFRAAPAGLTHAEHNTLNRRWLDLINQRQRTFLTGTLLEGRFVLRICVLSFRTHADRVDTALADVEAALAEATS